MNIKKIFTIAIATLLFLGCSAKGKVKEYDKPALYWYKNIVKQIVTSNLDKADNYYISLRSEHTRSPLLPTATMLLANTHMEQHAFIMADYYLDEYIKKYASGKRIEEAKFLKIKAAFLGIKDINKDQKLMMDTLQSVKAFIASYPSSIYLPAVNTIKVRLYMAEYMLNENISALYRRIDKPKAAEYYKDKNKNSPLNVVDIKAPKVNFIDSIFN